MNHLLRSRLCPVAARRRGTGTSRIGAILAAVAPAVGLALLAAGCASAGRRPARTAPEPLPGVLRIQNDVIQCTLRTNDLQIAISMLTSGRTWIASRPENLPQPAALPGKVLAAEVEGPRRIRLECEWVAPLEILLELPEAGAAVDFSIGLARTESDPDPLLPAGARLAFPFTPLQGGPVAYDRQEAVLPLGSGLLLPLAAAGLRTSLASGLPEQLPFYEHGLQLPFFGVQAGDAACMIELGTPFDAGLQWVEQKMREPGGGEAVELLLPALWHEPEKGRFAYQRRVRWTFFDRGGYGAMARAYRDSLQAEGGLVTWFQKAGTAVGLQRLYPALVVADTDTIGPPTWDPARAGLVGRHDVVILRRLAPGQPSAPGRATFWAAWPYLLSSPGGCTATHLVEADARVALQESRVDKTGQPLQTPPVLSSEAALEPLRVFLSDTALTSDIRGLFLPDLACSLEEDWNPLHPLTRRLDMTARRDLLGLAMSEAAVPVATRRGAWWAQADVALAIGALSVQPVWERFCELHGLADPAVEPPHDPDLALYMDLAWNPQTRIPLWQLVFHDSTVASAEPDEDPARFPSAWARYDLFHVLYGAPPAWWAPPPADPIDPAGASPRHWEDLVEMYGEWVPGIEATTYGERRLAELDLLAPWLIRCVHAHMTGHAFLSPDRMLQRTDFDNGLSAVVNFSDHTAHAAGSLGQVPPRGYVLVEEGVPFGRGQIDPIR